MPWHGAGRQGEVRGLRNCLKWSFSRGGAHTAIASSYGTILIDEVASSGYQNMCLRTGGAQACPPRHGPLATRKTLAPPPRPVEELETVVIRFCGDSGDGMQLTGTEFPKASALAGNDLPPLPDFPAEIRAPAGTLAGV